MSLKNGADSKKSRGRSLAFMLTAYYSLSAFLIVVLATGYLYWAMVRSMDLEDDRLLADRVQLLQTLVLHEPLNLSALRHEVDVAWQSGQRTRVFIRILDAQNQTICESKGMDQSLPQSVFPPPHEPPAAGSNLKLNVGPLHRIMAVRLYGPRDQSAPWIIQIGMDRSEEAEMLDEYRENLLLVLTFALLICAIAGYQISRRGMRPLFQITQVVNSTQPNNLSERIDSTGMPREFESLVETFNAMMDRLDRAFSRLTSFTADIAHELRTPVNNMRGELDVALTKPRSIEEYEEILGSSLEELGRLSRTIESLLFLARAENPQTQIEREQVDLGVELARIREFFDATAEDSRIALTTTVESDLKIEANRPLLQQAVGNLITNAISHTPSGGKVEIRGGRDGSSVSIEIIDSGSGIAAEHLPHIFNRFYRGDPSMSGHRPGVGIGLSIVKSIVDLHNGQIEISSQTGHGTRVRMRFPAPTTKMT